MRVSSVSNDILWLNTTVSITLMMFNINVPKIDCPGVIFVLVLVDHPGDSARANHNIILSFPNL